MRRASSLGQPLRRLDGARLDDSLGPRKALRVGIQRTLGETVFKTRVNPVTTYLADTVFDLLKIEAGVRGLTLVPSSA